MALIACPECKKNISDTAINCPDCGYLLTPEKIAEIKGVIAEAEKASQQTAKANAKGNGFGCLSAIIIIVISCYLSSLDRGWGVFISFLLILFGFTFYGHFKKWSLIISFGGGLVIACFAIPILAGIYSDKSSTQSEVTTQTSPQWLKGGTLHKSTFAQWDNSTYENRLATSSDFIIGLSDPKNHGMFFKDDCKLLRQFATAMEKCISEGNKKDGKLIYDKATVKAVAVNCWIIMGQQLPK